LTQRMWHEDRHGNEEGHGRSLGDERDATRFESECRGRSPAG
jgi:hypothetical protein